MLVSFDENILGQYGEILNHLHDTYLSDFYSENNVMPTENIIKVLRLPSITKRGVDLDSFTSMYGVWRYLNVKTESHAPPVWFPMVS